ncbi:hypothetical protein C8F01DRAFT_1150163 [Mycena amicta]|nr:hypothetical protein C8F01DRAFT_1150163 [Mycena amicta]
MQARWALLLAFYPLVCWKYSARVALKHSRTRSMYMRLSAISTRQMTLWDTSHPSTYACYASKKSFIATGALRNDKRRLTDTTMSRFLWVVKVNGRASPGGSAECAT